ncbi:hypothetical protein FISHEDRAFT_72619 [Fistulina hepatica ATCC 64428]|nr:hypothetical protein FISHEDRAFT_72619 [Fistulina hepatica ATCC 64428]
MALDANDEYDEDEDYEPDVDPDVFHIEGKLKKPEITNMDLKALNEKVHGGWIDLDPEYQRGVVWSAKKQSDLIHSIFHNITVPNLVFAVRKDEDGSDLWVCVDGKQRLTAVSYFMAGSIPYICPITKKKWKYVSSNPAQQIPEKYRKEFSSKTFTCVLQNDITPIQERQIFEAVQNGVVLTTAEKSRAIASPWTTYALCFLDDACVRKPTIASWIEDLVKRHIQTRDDGLDTLLRWNQSRNRDFQNFLNAVYCCEGYPNERRIPLHSHITPWLKRSDAPSKQFKDDCDEAFHKFRKIAANENLRKDITAANETMSPVEFAFICVLLFVHCNEELVDLAAAIGAMRRKLREKFDARVRPDIVQWLWCFIVQRLEFQEGCVLLKMSSDKANTKPRGPVAPRASPERRKRAAGEDEIDYAPTKRTRGRPAKARKF